MTPEWLLALGRAVRLAFGPLQAGFPEDWEILPPLHVNEAGWLEGEGVVLMPSDPSWYYPRLSTPHGDPLAIVCHASATSPGTGRNMARRRMRQRTAADRRASWHISVESSEIVQQAPLHVGCWHALGTIMGVGAANRTSIGVELVGWERGPWPEAQVQQACRVWRAIVQSYGIERRHAMVPHSAIDPDGRSDPGRPWMRDHSKRVLSFCYG